MNKTFEQIESEIRSELTNYHFRGITDTEEFLSGVIGKDVCHYDTKYDDGCGDDEDDDYVMKACFATDDNEYTIHIYYGDSTEIIGCVDVIHTAVSAPKNTIFLMVDEYTYDDERQDVIIIPCQTREGAIKVLKSRYEWYIEHSYLSSFVDMNGNVNEADFDDAYDSWDVADDYVDIYIASKDTSLSLYIKEETIRG